MSQPVLLIRQQGLCDYQQTWQAMRDFTATRSSDTLSELWIVQHPPVFTQGQAGKAEHILDPGNIPVIQTDRGGQVTYHGPGQMVLYLLLSLYEIDLGVRALVSAIEQAIIDVLADYQLAAHTQLGAPGVYIGTAKIAALGLRIRRAYSYHGLALNVDMDLEPFQRINPCGYADLAVTQMRDHGIQTDIQQVTDELIAHLCTKLGYQALLFSAKGSPSNQSLIATVRPYIQPLP